jgi:hypothetical protein
MMKPVGSHRLKFLFKLASPSFCDGPGFQDNICDSLRHQVVQILYELPCKNKKKDNHCPDFLFAHESFLLSSETVAYAIPHSAS